MKNVTSFISLTDIISFCYPEKQTQDEYIKPAALNFLASYLIKTHSELHNHITRNSSSLINQRFNLSIFQISFVLSIKKKSWNSLPSSTKNISNIQIFKIKLKSRFVLNFINCWSAFSSFTWVISAFCKSYFSCSLFKCK